MVKRRSGFQAAALLMLIASALASISYTQAEPVGSWTTQTVYPTKISSHSCATYSGYIYCVGGITDTILTGAVYSASVRGGTVGSWTPQTANPYPYPNSEFSCAAYLGYIYCVGGAPLGANDVYSASVSGGTVGSWTLQTANLYPTNIYGQSCAIDASSSPLYIYCVGGNTGSALTDAVYSASVSGGTVGSWTLQTANPFPTNISGQSCAIDSGYIYCVGGTPTETGETDAVYSASVSGGSVGKWTSRNSYPTTVAWQSCDVYALSNIYCVGGYTGSALTDAVYSASVSGGSVGSWTLSPNPYPMSVQYPSCGIDTFFMYCVGGSTSSGPTNGVYSAAILLETSTTLFATVSSITSTTSSASTTFSSQTPVSSATTTVSEPPLITNTLSTTTTTTGAVAGTSTTTFMSPFSTSYSTTSSVSSSTTSLTQTDTTTTSTVQSATTTSTGTVQSTTTTTGPLCEGETCGMVTVSETDTFNVLLTQIYQELEQFEAFILQTLGFQVTATPVGQEVDQVVVAVTTPTTSTTSLTSVTSSTTTTSSASTASTLQTVVGSTTTTSTEPPVNTNTITTTTTTTGLVAGRSTTTFTSPLSTSYSTTSSVSSSTTSFTQTGTTTTGMIQSATTTSTGTLLSTTASAGTVTVSETDTFNVLLTQIYQELEQFEAFILQTLGFQVTATRVGQRVNRIIVTLPHTETMVVSYGVVGGGSPTAPVFHYVLGGVGRSLTLPLNTPKSVQVDTGSAWSVTPNPLTGSTSSERWDSNQALFGKASSTTIVFTFYHQTLHTLSYTVAGGGTPSAPAFQSSQFGSPASVTLTTTPTGLWFDVGASWTVTNPLGGSTSSERWYTSHATSGTISSASTTAFSYQHQYLLTMLASPTTAGTVTPTTGWYNAGSKVTIKATAKTGHTFKSWKGTGTGSYTGTSNPATVTMNSAVTETANFT